MRSISPVCQPLSALACLLVCALSPLSVAGSDHADTPLLTELARHDAKITDLYAFVRGDHLVLIVCSDPTLGPGVTQYQFPTDVEFAVHIDSDSKVKFKSAFDLITYGGTIVKPDKIREDLSFRMRFDSQNQPLLEVDGLSSKAVGEVQLFAGVRDDPFIRGPRVGRNVAAIVLQVPLDRVRRNKKKSTLLIWATTHVEGMNAAFEDLAGRSLRSQFLENDLMNGTHPSRHLSDLGVTPDVIIYNTKSPAQFPNGRELSDDVVDLVGDTRLLVNDSPFPSANDLPFLSAFPYLAPPHGAP